jgi:hypothetical protein
MVTYTSMAQYRKAQEKRIQILKKGMRRGPITSAKYMVAQLRSIVPVDRGTLAASIKRSGSTVTARGSNPRNGFPYIHFINATPGSGLEKVAIPNRFRRKKLSELPNNSLYSDGSELSYYQNAKPGNRKGYRFYQKSLIKTADHFRKAMISLTERAWKAEF